MATQTKTPAAPSSIPSGSSQKRTPQLVSVPRDRLVPDPKNRVIVQDEELQGLADSLKILGVLEPIKVREREGEDLFDIKDGERRWTAAGLAGLAEVPCLVFDKSLSDADVIAAGIALNVHRVAHGAVHIARRLRDLKNQHGDTQEELARRTGIALPRAKLYLALLEASDHLLAFFAADDVPLVVAVEFMRYEKATSEAASRKLLERHQATPLSRRDLIELRKRATEKEPDTSKPTTSAPGRASTPRSFGEDLERAFQRDRVAALAELTAVLMRLGLQVVPAKSAA